MKIKLNIDDMQKMFDNRRNFFFCTKFAMPEIRNNEQIYLKKEKRKTNFVHIQMICANKMKCAPKCIRNVMTSTCGISTLLCYLELTACEDKLLSAKSKFLFFLLFLCRIVIYFHDTKKNILLISFQLVPTVYYTQFTKRTFMRCQSNTKRVYDIRRYDDVHCTYSGTVFVLTYA